MLIIFTISVTCVGPKSWDQNRTFRHMGVNAPWLPRLPAPVAPGVFSRPGPQWAPPAENSTKSLIIACKEKIGGCMWERMQWGCYWGVRDCRGGLIGVRFRSGWTSILRQTLFRHVKIIMLNFFCLNYPRGKAIFQTGCLTEIIGGSPCRTSLREGTRGSSFIIEWCQITLRGRRRIKQHFAHYAHYACRRSSRYKQVTVQFSSAPCYRPFSSSYRSVELAPPIQCSGCSGGWYCTHVRGPCAYLAQLVDLF
jgi:hypothetical protein